MTRHRDSGSRRKNGRGHEDKANKSRTSSDGATPKSLPRPPPLPRVTIPKNEDDYDEYGDSWAPTPHTAFKAILSARLSAAIWSNISDCDEVYNYWEPTHFLTYGTGFQTWEYSPTYAIRSYVYLCVHALPCLLYGAALQANKMLVFYFLRCLLALCCSLAEVYFYRSVLAVFGGSIARQMLLFLLFAPGMFISSTAYLPSSFSMYMVLLCYGAWLRGETELALVSVGISALVGWPFSLFVALPVVIDILFKQDFINVLKAGGICIMCVMIPMMFVDSHLYGRFVLAPLNIVLYNVFTPHGADLYGTEPMSFYFINGFLNFNLVFFLALAAPLCVVIRYRYNTNVYSMPSSYPMMIVLSGMYVWIVMFFPQAHKEERFLFPIYPLICLSATFFIENAQHLAKKILKVNILHAGIVVMYIVYIILGFSRMVAIYRGYRAPMDVYMELGKIADEEQLPRDKIINVCVGKEWYRFPSSFYLPANNWKLQFLKSEFEGQLPKYYGPGPNATSIIPTHMNNQNLEETSRYIDVRHCHFVVDSDSAVETKLQPNYSQNSTSWTSIFSAPFLDAPRSSRMFRAFYVPWFTETRCEYVQYHLLRSTRFKQRPRGG